LKLAINDRDNQRHNTSALHFDFARCVAAVFDFENNLAVLDELL
jgi:hypothetical protein